MPLIKNKANMRKYGEALVQSGVSNVELGKAYIKEADADLKYTHTSTQVDAGIVDLDVAPVNTLWEASKAIGQATDPV